MKTAIFHNFTAEPFTGYWNGKAKTFKPGEKVPMSIGLALHFAKHLTNQELLKKGLENYTSPKNPEQVPQFMELFKKACIVTDEAEENDIEADIKIAAGERAGGDTDGDASQPSMNVNVIKPKPIDPYDAHVNAVVPKGPSQVITAPDDKESSDEDTFEGLKE